MYSVYCSQLYHSQIKIIVSFLITSFIKVSFIIVSFIIVSFIIVSSTIDSFITVICIIDQDQNRPSLIHLLGK